MVVKPGKPLPMGARLVDGGLNIAVFSRHATQLDLLLFGAPEDTEPLLTLGLDPTAHRTGDVWHAWISEIRTGFCYGLKAHGPFEPAEGLLFDASRFLLDPRAAAIAEAAPWAHDYRVLELTRSTANQQGDPAGTTPKVLVVEDRFEWRGDIRPRHSWSETVIYETHVRGLTRHPSSGVSWPGTYRGLVEKIAYFKELGITAIELLPVQEFNANELARRDPMTGEALCNYWGYNTAAFFAPKASYASDAGVDAGITEFKEMVRSLHQAKIEVILDIALNHSAEGNESGPTLSFRGLDNSIYYMLDADRRHYRDYSGCGNTLNCNHPVVREFILDCLRHWVVEMHVDGFRFDLASILGRDENGNINPDTPLLRRIAEDPILREVKLIAEAWDVGGAYQLGAFPGRRWSEWNGRFRDDVRRFWRGDAGMAGALASRLCGSADLYQHSGKEPLNSINFVTCHDGFTLADLVSYGVKHNEANGENNRDGTDANYSWNCGAEGATNDQAIASLRVRQAKNLLATLMLSRGVPMLLGGDELGRSQLGNNNPYCQDNEISWYDWRLLDRNRELFRFVRDLIAFRKAHPILSREEFYTPEEVAWFAPSGQYPDWSAGDLTLGCVIRDLQAASASLCLLANARGHAVDFQVSPPPMGMSWRRVIDTAATAPADIAAPPKAPTVVGPQVRLHDHSLVVLTARG